MEEKHSSTDVIKLKNKINTIRTNKAKIQKASNILSTLGFIEEPEVDSDFHIVISEVDSVIMDINESLSSFINFFNDYEKAITEYLEESVPTVKYELKVYLQNSKKTVRYYYNSTYLFSAPIELKEELEIEFNSIMTQEPKLTLSEVKEKLTDLKNLRVMFRNVDSEVPTSEGLENETILAD